MADIIHRIGIKTSEDKVFQALSTIEGLSRWWTEETSGDSRVGSRINFLFRTASGDLKGKMGMEVTETGLNKFVRWKCVEGPSDWIGTSISFDLSTQDQQTILVFGHKNWTEASEGMAHCSMKWATFLLSLKSYLESGKGRPAPGDLKIDNWN